MYSILIGLAALAVLLEGLWAGIFLEHDGKRDAAAGWIDVHARGGEIAVLLAAAATVVAFQAARPQGIVGQQRRADRVIGRESLSRWPDP